MEPPARMDSESLRDEKVKVLKSIPALTAEDVVLGQFRGYRDERGVAAASQVETYAAVRLGIESWRWQGVPFYIRTGKCLPVTCTEVLIRLRRPPMVYPTAIPRSNYFRFRIIPGRPPPSASRRWTRATRWSASGPSSWPAGSPAPTSGRPTSAS